MAIPSFAEFVGGSWNVACYNRCKPSTRQRVDSALRTQLLPTFGERKLSEIGSLEVLAWFDRYSRTAPAGANRTLDILKQIFNYAIECGHVDFNPAQGVQHNPRPKVTRFLSRDEVARVHAALNAHRGRGSGQQQVAIIRLLLLTGCRKGELVNLRWEEVGEDVLRLSDSKTGPRTVFLSSAAHAVITRQPRTGSPYVFPSLTDASRPRSNELSLWRKVRREARIEGVRLHDLRHTFASHAVMGRVPLPVLSRLLGHSQDRMAMRYAHVCDREASDAAERIGSTIADLLGVSAPSCGSGDGRESLSLDPGNP